MKVLRWIDTSRTVFENEGGSPGWARRSQGPEIGTSQLIWACCEMNSMDIKSRWYTLQPDFDFHHSDGSSSFSLAADEGSV